MQSTNVLWHQHQITKVQRSEQKNQRPCLLWYTGLSGSGKSTIANAVDALLYQHGVHSFVLDGDNIRQGLNGDLGFSDTDRVENIRRIGEVSKLFVDAGLIVSTAFISPFNSERESVKAKFSQGEFIEIFVDTPLDVCQSRDPKGLYKKVAQGQIKNFTGIDSDYQNPINPQIHLKTAEKDISSCAQQVYTYLTSHGYLSQINK